MARPRPGSIDYDRLAEFLSALAYPIRLELLDRLRFSHTLAELKVPPRKVEAGGNPSRPAAKQTVQRHLDRLLNAGLLQRGIEERAGRTVPNYVVNPPKLYAIVEDLRSLSTMSTGPGVGGHQTATLAASKVAPRMRGPQLVLAHGVYEGKSFLLDDASRHDGAWVIGRNQGLAVTLDYDPYVSTKNATIARRGSTFVVTDARSKNGTSVNWEPLGYGASRELEPADVIGVGRSLLVFRPE